MRKIKIITNRIFRIFMCVFVLVISIGGFLYDWGVKEVSNVSNFKVSEFRKIFKMGEQKQPDVAVQPEIIEVVETIETKEESIAQKFTITAYDLSIASCGKSRNHIARGISREGVNLTGQNYQTARAIAVDPRVIPLGSKVRMEFIDEKYKKYSGIYEAIDTGGAIKGYHIDLFIEDSGEKRSKAAINFGKTQAMVEIIEEN